MFKFDVADAESSLMAFYWFNSLNDTRKDVLINMCFNLGLPRFLKFKKMIDALKAEDFEKAAEEMLDSLWAKQVHGRATELAYDMLNGKY